MRDWAPDLRARLAELRLNPAREAEIIEELSQHLDDRYDELRAAGSSDADARRLAIEELSEGGGLAQRMQALSQAHTPAPVVHGKPGAGLLRGVWQDLHCAMRTLRRQPGFVATIVLTLSLGIAVNTMVFTIVNGAVLRTLPFEDPERIVRLNVSNVGNAQNPGPDEISYLELQDWQTARRTFEQIAATAERGVDISGDGRAAARVSAAYVSWNTFSLIGQPPALGRDLRETDEQIGAAPVVILGGSLWRARYGADPSIVGKTIRVNGVPSTVVGVMPPDVGFPYRVEFWLPLVALSQPDRTSRSARVLDGVGRLRPGVSIEQATTELSAITTSLAERYPETNRDVAPRVTPFAIAPQFVAVMIALLGAVGFVLLIACANVANMLLARAADRSRDVTLRLALGASRWRIVRQLLVECLLLATASGACGLGLSYVGVQFFAGAALAETPSWMRFTIDGAVFAYLLALCLGSALVCGLVPAWHAARPNLAATLNDAGRANAGSRWRRRWTGAFVVAQVAAALVLLTGAMLMMKNLTSLMRTDIGVETSRLSQMAIILSQNRDSPDRRRLFLGQLEERLAANAKTNAAIASNAPMGGAHARKLLIDGRPAAEPQTLPLVSLIDVGQRYFDVVGASTIAGRALTTDDVRRPDDSVVVNERFAQMHFQDGTVIGKRIRLIELDARTDGSTETRWMTIVGVVSNVRQQWLQSGEFDPVVYRSYIVDPPQTMQVLARSESGPAVVAGLVGDQVRALDPDVPLLAMSTVDETLALWLWPQRLFGSMFTIFASIAMLLATGGLYSVTAYSVSRRTREIGVRVALGADARSVWWAVTGTTLRQLAIGLVLGTAGAAGVATVLPAFLVGSGGGANLVAYAGVVVVLVTVGVGASAVPARRAMRLDPVTALQTE